MRRPPTSCARWARRSVPASRRSTSRCATPSDRRAGCRASPASSSISPRGTPGPAARDCRWRGCSPPPHSIASRRTGRSRSARSPRPRAAPRVSWTRASSASRYAWGGEDTRLDLARVAAVRALSASVDISVDANGAWTADAARAACRDLAALGVVWVEQPTPDLAGLRAVRRDGAVRVRADESTRDAGDAAVLAESADGVHLKLEKSGTVLALAAAVADAREAGLDVALGQFDQGRLGCAATLHVAAALGFAKAELWGFADVATDIAAGIELAGPGFAVPDHPGLGVDLLTTLDWTSPS
ncbi:MAG: hypothetical protein PGN24_02530 [Microbacterium arborescens]